MLWQKRSEGHKRKRATAANKQMVAYEVSLAEAGTVLLLVADVATQSNASSNKAQTNSQDSNIRKNEIV